MQVLVLTDTICNSKYSIKEKIQRGKTIKEVKEKEIKIEVKEEETIRAYIEKEGTEIVYNEIIVGGIDKEGPVVNVTIPDIDKWTQSKTIQINATDIGVGIALRPYSYDGGTSRVLLSEVFKVSLDKLIKGDVDGLELPPLQKGAGV